MNIQTLQTNNQKRMTSQQIADLVKKRHDNVKRTIELVVKAGVIVQPQIEDEYSQDTMGRPRTMQVYVFAGDQGERDSLVVVAQLSPEFTGALIDRWRELETQASAPVIPQSFAEALQLAANQALQIEQNAPKVLHYDNVVERKGLLNATQVAQKLRLSAVAMNKILDELGVYNKAVKRSRVFQQWFIDKGLGEVKQTDQGYSQAMFTKRGEAWIIERLISEGVA
ncbi:phage antirepressor KilAC domain-containing protein [Psychrobacter sp. JB193]|uniref:phage antirepressor KilAC domain-containing protein n=1 Tax=Psychrobacter sp. JB193 TaxID=2024406 RepID=UPI000BAB196A|nr:phage antirepressor KilAC domain-containing protein [Psychrobacter sp. JB193]PAT64070.1 DNA-binding protein [Psychrobacter sp. JB193]